MATTKPRSEQLRLRSSKTGDHVLDTYIESAEIGSRTIAALLGDLFEANGVARSDLYEFRSKPDNSAIVQVRAGVSATGVDTGWIDAFDLNAHAAIYRVTARITGTGGITTLPGAINARNFTGHPNAVGTAMQILPNAHVSFYFDNGLYDWIGPTNVTVGLGGTRSVSAADLAYVGNSLPEAPLTGQEFVRVSGSWRVAGAGDGNFAAAFTTDPGSEDTKTGDFLVQPAAFSYRNIENTAWVELATKAWVLSVETALDVRIDAQDTIIAGHTSQIAAANGAIAAESVARASADGGLQASISALTGTVASEVARLDGEIGTFNDDIMDQVEQGYAPVSRPVENLLINPFFEVADRETSATSGGYFCDRWKLLLATSLDEKFSAAVSPDDYGMSAHGKPCANFTCAEVVPTIPDEGFAAVTQSIEGYVGNALAWGLPAAKSAVISGRIRHYNANGQNATPGPGETKLSLFIRVGQDGGDGWLRSIVFPLVMPASALVAGLGTPYDFSFVIPPLTATVPGLDRKSGAYCQVGIVFAGENVADYTTLTPGEWTSGGAIAHNEQNHGLLSVGAGFSLTDMALVVGTRKTDVMVRPFAEEQRLCRRYHQWFGELYPYLPNETVVPNNGTLTIPWSVEMSRIPDVYYTTNNGGTMNAVGDTLILYISGAQDSTWITQLSADAEVWNE